jgi:hypothetical protein
VTLELRENVACHRPDGFKLNPRMMSQGANAIRRWQLKVAGLLRGIRQLSVRIWASRPTRLKVTVGDAVIGTGSKD